MVKNFILVGKSSLFNKSIKKIIKRNYLSNYTYIKKNSIPTVSEFLQIVRKCNQIAPKKIVAIGGGCVIDYAKLLSIFYNQDINILIKKKFEKIKKLNRKIKLEIFPTTAGSGSEATSFSVLYFDTFKESFVNKNMLPDKVFLRPELLLTLKKKNRASSGFDVIAQAIESMLSKQSSRISSLYSRKALKLAYKNFLSFVNEPNLYSAKNMLVSANLSGKAINIAKTNGPHALSYPFTTLYHIPHGQAVSINFLKILKHNFCIANTQIKYRNTLKKFEKIFKTLDLKNFNQFEKWITKIILKANLKVRYPGFKIKVKKDINKIIDRTNLERLRNNPVPLNKKDIRKILLN